MLTVRVLTTAVIWMTLLALLDPPRLTDMLLMLLLTLSTGLSELYTCGHVCTLISNDNDQDRVATLTDHWFQSHLRLRCFHCYYWYCCLQVHDDGQRGYHLMA